MVAAVETHARAQDLHANLKPSMYKEAAKRGLTLSGFLEKEDPSAGYNDGLDAFERQLKLAGIVTRSDPAAGYYANTWEEAFDRTPQGQVLAYEWAARISRQVQGDQSLSRSVQMSDFAALGGAARPYAEAAGARETQVLTTIPIGELIAITTPIVGDAYRAATMTDPPAADTRLVRVAQGAEIPRTKVTASEQITRLYKYARGLEVTYELLRRSRLDMVAFWVRRVARQLNGDKLGTIVEILVAAATSYDMTDLDSGATPGTLSLKGWLSLKNKFPDPYMLNTVLVQEAVALQLQLLNLGSANVPLVAVQASMGLGSLTPINSNLRDNVRYGQTSEAPALKILALDRRLALERVIEIDADIDEVERYASRQTQALFLSEVEGYSVIDANAIRLMDVNA